MSVQRGDKVLVIGLGVLAVAAAGLLTFFLFLKDDGSTASPDDVERTTMRGRERVGAFAGEGREVAAATDEELEEDSDPSRFAALIEELRLAILDGAVERAQSLVEKNPGLLRAAVPMLIGILEDPSPGEKSKILTIEFLKRVPTPEVLAALRKALQREAMLGVRKALLMALAEMKDVEAIPIIAKLLLDPSEIHEIRVMAADALGWIGHPDGTPPLLQMFDVLKGSLFTDAEKSLMSHVLQSLGMIKDRRATAPLLAILTAPGTDPWLVWQLVRAMGGIADPATREALLAIARAEAGASAFGKNSRLDAIRALFAVAAGGDAAAAQGIIELFQSLPDETFKKEALHNLAKLADNGDVLKELNGVLDTSEQFAFKDLAVRGLAYKGGAESVDRIMQELRASETYDAKDILSKLGQQLSRSTDPAAREALRQKIAEVMKAENDERILVELVEGMGKTADPVLAEVIVERVLGSESGTFREQGYYALAYAKPSSALPAIETAVLDIERHGQERYAAIEALAWWDNEEAISVLERLRGSFTAEEDGAYLIAIDGAINRVRANIAAKGRRK